MQDRPGEFAREIDPQEVAAMAQTEEAEGQRRGKRSLGIPPVPADPRLLRKGRGATINPPNRYDSQETVVFDDGWQTIAAELADLPPLPTTLIRDSSRSVISWNQSPDIGFDRAVNPYRGC